jgi:8-oxo-dGTP pyrophosphatase MutT (NUDIX family)
VVVMLMTKDEDPKWVAQARHIWLAQRCAKDRPYCGLWAAPGGSIDEGEEPLAAAVREVEEETGLKLDPSRFVYGTRSEHAYDDGTPFSMHWFSIMLEPDEVPRNIEPHKQKEWMLWTFNAELPEALLPRMTPGTLESLRALRKEA